MLKYLKNTLNILAKMKRIVKRMEIIMKKVKIFVLDVDGTLIPQSILFKIIDKTNAIASLSYLANRCFKKEQINLLLYQCGKQCYFLPR